MLPSHDCRGKNLSISERFWCKVDVGPQDQCWEWQAARHNYRGGYGTFRIRAGRMTQAHRFAFQDTYGADIPSGMEIDHLCKNPPCVNPEHLDLVTPQENSLRGDSPSAKAVRAGKCSRGHDLAGAKTYTRSNGRSVRCCQECDTLRARGRRRNPEVRERQREQDRAYRARLRMQRKAGQ
jgi:hypothetical protein